MKKIWLVVVGVVLLMGVVGLTGCGSQFVGVGSAGGQQTGIWVTGQGKVTAVPDVAIISVGVDSQAATVAAAQSAATVAMDKVMDALKAQGVVKEDIQTQYFSIQEVTKWDPNKQESVTTGYRVTNTVTAKIREIQKVGSVIDAVAVAGGDLTRISGVSFTIDDPTKQYAEARIKAVADAKAKAEQMASLTGLELGSVTYITESSYMPGPIYRNDLIKAEAAGAPSTPISAGEMEITTTVQIAYAIAY